MKRTLKALFALMMGAAMGSSAWAAPKERIEREISVGESTEVFEFQYDKTDDSEGALDRWWKLVGTGDAGSSDAVFVEPEPMEGKSYRSSTHSTLARFKFVGKSVGTFTWTTYWTSPYSSDPSTVPNDDPSNATGTAGYPSGSDTWAGSNKNGYYNEYVITVVDPDAPERWEDVRLLPGGEGKSVEQTGGAANTAWSTVVRGDKAAVQLNKTEATGARFDLVITPTSVEGAAEVIVKRDGVATVGYRVRVAESSVEDLVVATGAENIGTADVPIYRFTSTTGTKSLTVPAGYVATARILVVGGGGAGGTGKSSTQSARYGNGGNGGTVKEDDYSIFASTLTIKVGAGGTVTTDSNADGGKGGESAVESSDSKFTTITADGGDGGKGNNTASNASAGSPTRGTQSAIDGETYGAGGAKYTNATAKDGDSNTGNGGQGGRANSTANNRKGGNGGSGVVIVKITALTKLEKPVVDNANAGTITYGQALSTITSFQATMKNAAGGAVAGTFAWKSGSTKPAVADSGVVQYGATFTPDDMTKYFGPVDVVLSVTVQKATPTVAAWPTVAGPVYAGKTLGAYSLEGGRASVDGSFAWANGEAVLAEGDEQPFDVVFNPADAANYGTATGSVKLNVVKPPKDPIEYTDVGSTSDLNGRGLDDEKNYAVIKTDDVYTFDTASSVSWVEVTAKSFAVAANFVLKAEELAKYTLNGVSGEDFAAALLGEKGTLRDAAFALGEGGTPSVTFAKGALAYADDTTVDIPGGLVLDGDLTVAIAAGKTLTVAAGTAVSGSGKIVLEGKGLIDFADETVEVSAPGFSGKVDGEPHQPVVEVTAFEPAAEVLPERAVVVEYDAAGAWTTEAPSFSAVCDTTVNYRVTVGGVEKKTGSYKVQITAWEDKTESVTLTVGEARQFVCEGPLDEEWTVTSAGSEVSVSPASGSGRMIVITLTAGSAATASPVAVTVKCDSITYTYNVTVAAAYTASKVNLAYGGADMADEVTFYWWYRNNATSFKPRHFQATTNAANNSTYSRTDRSDAAIAACNAILDVDLHDTTAYACAATKMAAKASEGTTEIAVWRSSDEVGSDGTLGGTPQKNGDYAVELKSKRVVYVGKTVKAYCYSSCGTDGSGQFESQAWTATSANGSIATVTASGAAAASFEPEFTGVNVGRTFARIANVQETQNATLSGNWPTDTPSEDRLTTANVTNGAVYKLWVEVRDVPALSGSLTVGAIKEGETLEKSAVTGTMVDSRGNAVKGTFAWFDASIKPKQTDSQKAEYVVVFTPDATEPNGAFYDEVKLVTTLEVKPPFVEIPTAAEGLVYNGKEQVGVKAGEGYTLSGTTAATDANTYTATAKLLENSPGWSDGTFGEKTISWTIARAPIDSASAAAQTYTGSPLKPVLTVKAGGLALEESDYELGSWNGSLTAAGTYTATVTGKGNFTGSRTVEFVIGKATYDMTGVSFDDGKTVVYDGLVHVLEISGDLPAGVKVSYEGNDSADAGEHTVTAVFTGDAANYNEIPSKTAKIVIEKAALQSATAAAQTYDGKVLTPVLTVTTQNGLTVPPAGYTIGEWSDSLTAAGTYTATVTANENGNYTGTADVSFTIQRRPVTVTAKSYTITPDKDCPTLEYDITAGSLAEGEALVGELACDPAFDKGMVKTYDIVRGTLTDDSNPNYEITFVPGKLSVSSLVVSFSPESGVYNGQTYEPTVSVQTIGGDVISLDDCSVQKQGGNLKDAGSCEYTVTVLKGTFSGLIGKGTFVVAPKPVAVTAKAGEKTYGDEEPDSFGYESDELVGSDAFEGSLVRQEGETVGDYPIGRGTLTAGRNYTIDFTGANFTIKPATLTVTAASKTITYGDPKPAGFEYEITGYKRGDTKDVVTGEPKLACDYEPNDAADAYDITVDITDLSAPNYVFSGVKGTLTVEPKEIDEASAASQTYTGSALEPVLTVKAGDFTLEAGTDYELGDWSDSLTAAGTYTATVTGTGSFKGSKTVSFTIEQAEYDLSGVTFEDAELTYNGEVQKLAIEGDLPSGVQVSYLENENVNAGTYEVTAQFTGDAANYKAIPERKAKLTIKPAALQSATAEAQEYAGEVLTPVLTVTTANGLAVPDTAYDLSAWSGELKAADTYTATVTAKADGNYTGTADVSFTINPRPITVKAKDVAVKPGEDLPKPLGYDITSGSLAAGDSLSGELACPDFRQTVGIYDITQGTLANDNYDITFESGKAYVSDLVFEFSETNVIYDGKEHDPTVTVKDSGGNVLTVSLKKPDGRKDAGTYTYEATVTAGDLQGMVGYGTFVIAKKQAAVVVDQGQGKVYGDLDPPVLTYRGSELCPGDEYTGSLERATGENAGEYDIGLGTLTAGKNYNTVLSTEQKFTIRPKTLTEGMVKLSGLPLVYNGGNQKPTVTVSDPGATITPDDYVVVNEGGVAAVEYEVTVTPRRNYTGEPVVIVYEIGRKEAKVKAEDAEMTFGDADPVFTATVDGLVGSDTVTYKVGHEGNIGAGVWDLTPTVETAEQGNYTVVCDTGNPGKLTVNKRRIYITVVETNKVYGAEDPDFTYVVYSNAERTVELKTLPNGQPVVLNGKLRRTAGEDVKDSPYDVDDLTDCNETNNSNYIFEEMLDGEDKFTITPAKLTVKADDKTILLGEEVLELTATFTGLTNDDAQDVIDYRLYVRDLDAAVGEYTIVAEAGATTNANYDVTYVTGTLTISGGKIIVNGKGYDDLNAAFEELEENGGTATVNEDFSYGGYAFTEGSTLTVDKETGALSVNGMLTLLGDLRVGTVVTATNVVLAADVTVGVTEETTSELAILTFKELGLGGYKLTLTTNGVIRSAKKLEIKNVFVEPSKAYEVIETEVSGVWEYTAVLRGFIITFNSNGGSAVEPIVASAGETVKGPEGDPTRTGYGFDGWYTNDVEVSFPLTMPMADFTLDAHWTANTYKVAYDSNGGEGASVTNDAAYDAEFEVAACMFTKTGYTFAGWTTNLQSAAEFQPGDSVSNLTAEAGATVTMYATWTGNVYQVVYDPNGGEGAAATSNATYDVEFAIAGNPGFSKTGYTFESWTNAAGDVFAIGAPATNLATSGEVTLYAAWTPNGYTLTYKPGEGTGDDIETNLTYDVKHTVIGKPDDFVKTGYSFAGWADGEGAVVTHRPGNVVANLTNEQDAVVTWTAVWTGNVYTVTFNPANGEAPFSFSTNCDAMVEAPADPTKTGYTFRYWSTNGVEVVFPIAMPADGLEVTALWNANEYKVEYSPNGGAGEAAMSNATYDVEFAVAGNPGFAKTGYSFNSWTNAEGTVFAFGAPATNLAASGEVKLYAAWTPNGYTLTYRAGEGEGDDIVSNLVYDVGYEVADCTFAKAGYSFRNWTNESGVAYLPGQAITNLAVSGNVDFTAVWTANVYTVTFNLAGGTGVCDPIVAFCDAMIDAPAAPTKKGCVFGGWYEGGSEFTFPAAMPAHDVVLTAQWDPLEIGPGVKAYFDSDLDTVVLELDGTGAIDLVALTNKLIQAGVPVDPDDFNAVVKTDEGGFVTPAGWTDATDPDTFDKTLGDALKGGVTSVFVCEDEPPAEIIEKREVEVEPGVIKVVTAVVENDATGVESNAIQVAAAEGLADIAQERNTNVTLRVEATPEADVGKENVLALKSVSISGIDGVESYRADYVSLTVLYGDDQVTELDTAISIFIPWSFNAQCTYRMSRIHNGVAEVIPEGAENAVDGEYVERLSDGFRVHLRKFSDYAIAEIVAKPSPEPKPSLVPELYENVSPETLAADPFVGNTTYNGWTRGADGEITGSLIVKAGKANKNTGVTKLTVTYTPVGGKKRKITIEKSAMPVAGGNPTVCIPGIGTVQFAGDTIVGVDCDVQMGKDLFKDKATKKAAAATVPQGAWTFAVPSAKGYASFSVTVSKKGKAKVKGVMSDGTKVSVSVQGVFGDSGKFAIPVVYAKKTVSVSFVMWINRDKNISCITDSADEGWNGLEPSTAIALADGPHAVSVEDLGIAQAFEVAGKKWTFPKYSKRDPSLNPASVKLTWTQKTGVVKGSFKIEKTKFTVSGVVVDGVVYGSAFKKGVGSHSLVAE